MAQMTVDTHEARLIVVLRAINAFNEDDANGLDLIDGSEVGELLDALEHVVDLSKREEDYSGAQLKAMMYGFVAGVAASRLATLAANGIHPLESDSEDEEQQEQLPDEVAGMTVSGGPSGGVVAGQGHDPRYVTQSGPQQQ